jgi:RimJ/RimL family protein N-acetyltransferase
MSTNPAHPAPGRLPDGRLFDPNRPRSAGPLDEAELAWCRSNGLELAYDPAQIGWVVRGCPDDLDPPDRAEPSGADAPTEGLQLRPWREDEAAAFAALLDDAKVWRHLPEAYPDPLTEDDARDLIALSNAADHHDVRAIELDGTPLGQVRLAFDQTGGGRSEAEISYWLGRAWWGQGLASAAVARFSQECFARHAGLKAIVARVHRDNAASARVLQKAGYASAGPAPEDPAIVLYRLRRGQAAVPARG